MAIFKILFFPFRMFFGKKSPMRRTVAEQRRDDSRKLQEVANRIQTLHARIVALEQREPYEHNDKRRRSMALEKLRLEQEVKQLEGRHHKLARRIAG